MRRVYPGTHGHVFEQGRGQDPHDGDNERAKAPDAVRATIVTVAAEETETTKHDKQINAGQQETDQRHYHHGLNTSLIQE